jgi:4-amino-4-deoxy-L-arabinose transferase-like glycosyltransferase
MHPQHQTTPAHLSWLGIGLIVAVGGTLRFWHLDSGIPYKVGVDEPFLAHAAVGIMTSGDFNPHFFDYPGLYIYVELLVACARFLVGSMDGQWSSLAQFGPDDIYLWWRVVTAAIGTLTIVVVYRIGLRWGPHQALLAAALLAVFLNHVRESHFALTDTPLTFLVALTFLLSLRAHESGRLASFVGAGVAAGLAAATKYNGAVVLLLPLMAAWMTPGARRSRLLGSGAACAGCAIAFLAGAPYTVLDLPGFLDGFANLSRSYQARTDFSGWSIYLGHLRVALARPGVILLFAGFALCVWRAVRGPHRLRSALLVTFPLVYFYLIASRGLIYARYYLPAIPFLCLLTSVLLVTACGAIQRSNLSPTLRRTAITALVMVMLTYPTWASVNWVLTHGAPTTEEAAYKFLTRLMPADSKLAVEGDVLHIHHRFHPIYVRTLIAQSYDDYQADGVTFLVASSTVFGEAFAAPDDHPDTYAAYRRLFDRAIGPIIISPTAERSGPEIRIYQLSQ